MSWKKLLRDGRIEGHPSQRSEIAAHRRSAERSLADAGLAGISPEGRFQLAYDAVLSLATLVVLAAGYRIKSRVGHHQLTLEAAGIALSPEHLELIQYFDLCRRMRNSLSYDGDEVGDEEANELLAEVNRFLVVVDTWLSAEHPDLG